MTEEEYQKKMEAELMKLALSKSTMFGGHIVSVNRYYAKHHYLTTEEIILTVKAMDFIDDLVR
jgi:hypothetical protein